MPQKIVGLLKIIQIDNHHRAQRVLISVLNSVMNQLLGGSLIINARQRVFLRPQKELHFFFLSVINVDHTTHDTGHISLCTQKGRQVGLIPCIVFIEPLNPKFNGVMLGRLEQTLQNSLVIGNVFLVDHCRIKSLHISAVDFILRHAVLIVRPDNHNVRLGIVINNLFALSLGQNVQTLRLSLQLFLHTLSLCDILDHRYNRIFSSLSGIKISPDMQPAQITAAGYRTKLSIYHTVILKHIPDSLPVGRKVIRNNTQLHSLQILHALYPGIAKHAEKSFVDKDGLHLPILILEETDSCYDIVDHRAKVFNT